MRCSDGDVHEKTGLVDQRFRQVGGQTNPIPIHLLTQVVIIAMMAVMHNGRRLVHQRVARGDNSKESRKIITTTRCAAGA
jgi:hypothetical protein